MLRYLFWFVSTKFKINYWFKSHASLKIYLTNLLDNNIVVDDIMETFEDQIARSGGNTDASRKNGAHHRRQLELGAAMLALGSPVDLLRPGMPKKWVIKN